MNQMTDMTPATPSIVVPMAVAPAAFDLQSLESVMLDEAWLTVLHPQTLEPTPIKIKVASPESESYKKVERRIRNRNVALLKKSKSGLSAEALEASAMDLLVGVTVDWQGVTWGNALLEFTPDNARMLYGKFSFIKEQVDEFIGDRASFFSN